MSVFICWSSEQSKKLAEAVKALLESAVPSLKRGKAVFISGSIDKGVNWFDSIIGHLKSSKAGMVCLTPENLQSPCISRLEPWQWDSLPRKKQEAVAPSKPPLLTLVHGVTGAELKGPLSAYQSTSTTPAEMGALVQWLRSQTTERPENSDARRLVSAALEFVKSEFRRSSEIGCRSSHRATLG